MHTDRRVYHGCQAGCGEEHQRPADKSHRPCGQFVLVMRRFDGLRDGVLAGQNDQHFGLAAGNVRTHETIFVFADDCVLKKEL